jgi:hypothetical protein
VLKVANIFKIGRNHEYAENNLFKSMRSKSAIIKENTKKQELEYTKYILPDIWDIYKKLRKSESFVKKLPKNYSTKGQLVQGLVLCFINGLRYVIKINNNNIPLWKENWDKNKAYKLCENLIPLVVKELNKAPYKDMKPEYVYRDPNFQTIMKVLFADKLT